MEPFSLWSSPWVTWSFWSLRFRNFLKCQAEGHLIKNVILHFIQHLNVTSLFWPRDSQVTWRPISSALALTASAKNLYSNFETPCIVLNWYCYYLQGGIFGKLGSKFEPNISKNCKREKTENFKLWHPVDSCTKFTTSFARQCVLNCSLALFKWPRLTQVDFNLI